MKLIVSRALFIKNAALQMVGQINTAGYRKVKLFSPALNDHLLTPPQTQYTPCKQNHMKQNCWP
jgi:hypothetical protein